MSLPSGWVFSSETSPGLAGQTASIVLPAAGSTVRHVITDVTFRVVGENAAAAYSTTVSILDGAVVILGPKLLIIGITTSNAKDSDEISLSGVTLLGSAGASMTIQFNSVSINNVTQAILAQGYDL